MKKLISVTTSCYNEKDNIKLWYNKVLEVMNKFPQYDYEVIVADNCSTDGTREILRQIAFENKNFKVIFNSNNFGASRSGYNAFIEGKGDAVVCMCADLQDPPELIEEFIKKWEEGYKVVCAVKEKTKENFVMSGIRKAFYKILETLSAQNTIKNYYGFGMYDKQVIEALKKYNEPYPFMRGLIQEIGFKRTEIKFFQPQRQSGKSSYNLFSYYDVAINGLVNHSKLPLRFAGFLGFIMAFLSILAAFIYLVLKLMYWNAFSLGIAPQTIGLFLLFSIQFIFIGIMGEYLGAVWTQVKNKPLVIVEERINFEG